MTDEMDRKLKFLFLFSRIIHKIVYIIYKGRPFENKYTSPSVINILLTFCGQMYYNKLTAKIQ